MPRQVQQNSLAARLGEGARKAVEVYRTEEIDYGGGGDLPAGIPNGIAQLKKCGFGIYQKGEFKGKDYYLAQGVVVSPDEFSGFPVGGLRTKVGPIPLCDTPRREGKPTQNHHIKDVVQEFKKLLKDPDTGKDNATEITTDDFESVAAQLEQDQPYFRFRTWGSSKQEIEHRGDKWYCTQDGKDIGGPFLSEAALKARFPGAGREPMVNHQWLGRCNYVPPEPVEVADTTAAGEGTATAPAARPKGGNAPVKSPEPVEPEAVEGETDLDSLAMRADANNEQEAGAELEKLALEAGLSEKQIKNAKNWAAVVEMLREVGDQGSPVEEEGAVEEEASESQVEEETDVGEEAAEEKPWVPELDSTYNWVPPGKRKPTEVLVLEVFDKAQTVRVKDLTTNKVFKGVPWSKLTSAE